MNFFALSRDEKDVVMSAMIAGFIARKTAKQVRLIVRKHVNFSVAGVKIEIPPAGGDFRWVRSGPVHPKILTDDTGAEYVNTWLGQQRGKYRDSAGTFSLQAALDITSDILLDLGIRPRVTVEDFLFKPIACCAEGVKINELSLAEKVVFFLGDAVGYEAIAQLSSNLCNFHYMFCPDISGNKTHRMQGVPSNNVVSAMAMADFVVVDEINTLLPYLSAIKDKKIILTSAEEHVTGIVNLKQVNSELMSKDNFHVEFHKAYG